MDTTAPAVSSASNPTPYLPGPSVYPGGPPAVATTPSNVIYTDMATSSAYHWPPAPGQPGTDVYYPEYGNIENAGYYDQQPPATTTIHGQLPMAPSTQQYTGQVPAQIPVIQNGNPFPNQQIPPGPYNHPANWQPYPVPPTGQIPSDPNFVYLAPPVSTAKDHFYETPYPTMPPTTAGYPPNPMLSMQPTPAMYTNMPLTSDNNRNTPTIASSSRPAKAVSAAPSDGSGDEPRDVNRRLTNNTRERIRVRDINDNFKELNEMLAIYDPINGKKNLTKLGILNATTDLIDRLQKEVARRNLQHKLKFDPSK
uniref:BHLH domain-containing protein n=1 Tax=Panagrellus redivivus TaxID=6233 RepID=A0A7E4VWM3_PANRE